MDAPGLLNAGAGLSRPALDLIQGPAWRLGDFLRVCKG